MRFRIRRASVMYKTNENDKPPCKEAVLRPTSNFGEFIYTIDLNDLDGLLDMVPVVVRQDGAADSLPTIIIYDDWIE